MSGTRLDCLLVCWVVVGPQMRTCLLICWVDVGPQMNQNTLATISKMDKNCDCHHTKITSIGTPSMLPNLFSGTCSFQDCHTLMFLVLSSFFFNMIFYHKYSTISTITYSLRKNKLQAVELLIQVRLPRE